MQARRGKGSSADNRASHATTRNVRREADQQEAADEEEDEGDEEEEDELKEVPVGRDDHLWIPN